MTEYFCGVKSLQIWFNTNTKAVLNMRTDPGKKWRGTFLWSLGSQTALCVNSVKSQSLLQLSHLHTRTHFIILPELIACISPNLPHLSLSFLSSDTHAPLFASLTLKIECVVSGCAFHTEQLQIKTCILYFRFHVNCILYVFVFFHRMNSLSQIISLEGMNRLHA